MNKCRYCKKELTKTEFGWNICECEKAQKEWSVQMRIQEYKRCLSIAQKELHQLKESAENNKNG